MGDFFLPALGWRHFDDGLLNAPCTFGNYWSSTVADNTRSFNLNPSISGSHPANIASQGYGFTIRCVR